MTDLITLILISSSVSVGFYIACTFEGSDSFDTSERWIQKRWHKPDDKMILWWVRYYLGRYIPLYWTKPIYSCLPCMGSVHSFWPLLWLGYDIWLWPVVAIATVGLNYMITIWWSK